MPPCLRNAPSEILARIGNGGVDEGPARGSAIADPVQSSWL